MANGTTQAELESEEHPNFKALNDAGLLACNTIHPKKLAQINALSEVEICALIAVHKKLGTLGVFFDGITPQ